MLVIYKFLQGRNERIVVDMEEDALGMVDLLGDHVRADAKASDEKAEERRRAAPTEEPKA